MMKTAEITATDLPWDTFEVHKGQLFDQFRTGEYDESTGESVQAVRARLSAFEAEHAEMPRVLLKAHGFRIVLEHCRLRFHPCAWFAGDFEHGNLLAEQRQRWNDEIESTHLQKESQWFDAAYEAGALRGKLDFHHIAPGWENIFHAGLGGLIERAESRLDTATADLDEAQRAFLEAVIIVNRASIDLAGRFSAYLKRRAAEGGEYTPRMLRISEILENVPGRRPAGFYEALQAMWLVQMLVELEGESTMSFGHFDRMLHPYLAKDLETERLTKTQAKELLKYFWFRFHARRRGEGDSARNFTFAGQTRTGEDATNDLTYLALDAIEELDCPEPKASIRFFPGSPDRLYRRVADLIRSGHTSMVLMNDEPSIQGLVERGKTIEDARSYLSIGCYEPAVDGKDMACTMNIPVNLAKGIELALNGGVDPGTGALIGAPCLDPDALSSFDDVFSAYTTQMDSLLETAHRYLCKYEQYWSEINPSPFIASSIDDCIVRGKDIGDGGCFYNSVGCPAGALAEASDSLLAIRTAVFEERKYTLPQIVDAMRDDFADNEPMRLYLRNQIPKWGQNDNEADAMARRVANYYCDKIHGFRTTRGGPYQAGLFALRFQWTYGKRTGALPCGRKAGTPTAPGISAGAGLDTRGITSLMGSLEKLDYAKAPDGSVLDLMLHPSTVAGPEGRENLVALIKTHFQRGGNYLQFNVVDSDTLVDAQLRPEVHSGLQVRITGYSAFFTKISKYEQDLFINRIKHSL